MSIGLIRARSYVGDENRDLERDCIFVANDAIRQRTGSSIKVYFPHHEQLPPDRKRRRQVADADETSEGAREGQLSANRRACFFHFLVPRSFSRRRRVGIITEIVFRSPGTMGANTMYGDKNGAWLRSDVPCEGIRRVIGWNDGGFSYGCLGGRS
jgi:hypothetical protein